MALGKNIGAKSGEKIEPEKMNVSRSSKVAKKITKKELISKTKKENSKIEDSFIDKHLIRFLSEETRRRKTELRDKYTKEISLLRESKVQFIVLKVGDEEFAIDIDKVKEVVPFSKVAKIPNSPAHLIGALRVRNQTFMGIDLQAKFQQTIQVNYEFVVALNNGNHKVAILVSELPIALKIDGGKINSSLSDLELSLEDETYIKGIIELDDRTIFYLDIEGFIEGDKAIVIPDEILVT